MKNLKFNTRLITLWNILMYVLLFFGDRLMMIPIFWHILIYPMLLFGARVIYAKEKEVLEEEYDIKDPYTLGQALFTYNVLNLSVFAFVFILMVGTDLLSVNNVRIYLLILFALPWLLRVYLVEFRVKVFEFEESPILRRRRKKKAVYEDVLDQ